ncbi:MAG: HAD family hydrolase [Sphingobium sp.]|uniref:HAD family hydrolase n=1 Tax=Sphingobium sp. TaxID=1912891 RepID=UPI0029B25CBD|nr:HAD family hydrolase [Sphingobium sp.]MDX3908646.1 HAD family hydrolase [Sphingobium sp.]
MQLAIYDMDRTITKRGTFTPFLIFAAQQRAPWRLAALPLWLAAMAAHKGGLIARKPLKQFGLRLFLGSTISPETAKLLAERYAARTLAHNIQPGALAQIAEDRAAGRMLVMATAAPEFYAQRIGAALGFDAVIATRHRRIGRNISHRIDGENCYGPHKLAMIRAWLQANGSTPISTCFYSDDISDAPTLNWADEAYVVNAGAVLARISAGHGWHSIDFQQQQLSRHDDKDCEID